jgi:outer membrane protein assembly factor BamB
MTGTYDCPYVYSVQTKGTQNYLIKWTTDGISSNFTSRIMYNVTYPLNGITGIYDSPNAAGAVNGVGVLPGSNSVGFYFGNTVAGTSDYATMYTSGAFNCATGQMLWMQNYTYAMQTFSPSCGEIASPGVYTNALYAGDPNQNGMRPLIGIDIYTGNILFNNTVTSYPWGSFWSYSMAGAYGMVYYPTYTGYVYAFNDTTGAIVWKGGYNYAGYETPYGYQPFFAAILVGGGYVYAGNGEHSEGPPYYQGKQLWCLNATTGATVWSIPFWLQTQQCYAIIADGLLIATNYYDDRQYCFGMGPSATTVTAPDIGVTTSTPVTITGTVTDISTGATQKVVAANFPHGLPCVSDASQSAWMSYVYMQKPMPTNVTGVPVTISVLDSNGNYRQIGQTTSDTSGTFAFTWTPDIPGSYTVIATFAGTQSYYGSNAETHFYASAPAPTASPYPQVSLSATGTAIGEAAAAIIIAIAIGFAITILMLRKRP